MGRPKLESTMETVSARLPREMVDRIDAYLEGLHDKMPLFKPNRADAVRALLAMGLEAAGGKTKPRKRRD